jgi:catechol 2,3-dioxygenase-like lactoylglutathione lyase family enzyme
VGLTDILLYAKDLPAMLRFYNEVLGLPILPDTQTPHYVQLNAGGLTLSLHAIPAHIADTFEITTPPTPREDSPFKLTFSVADPAALQANLEALNLPILPRPWGTWDFTDPEGNILAVAK